MFHINKRPLRYRGFADIGSLHRGIDRFGNSLIQVFQEYGQGIGHSGHCNSCLHLLCAPMSLVRQSSYTLYVAHPLLMCPRHGIPISSATMRQSGATPENSGMLCDCSRAITARSVKTDSNVPLLNVTLTLFDYGNTLTQKEEPCERMYYTKETNAIASRTNYLRCFSCSGTIFMSSCFTRRIAPPQNHPVRFR